MRDNASIRAEMAVLLNDVYRTSCLPPRPESTSEIKVYAVLTITVLLMILTLVNGTEYQGFAFRVAIIGIFLSISWWVADRFCVARRVMKQVRKL